MPPFKRQTVFYEAIEKRLQEYPLGPSSPIEAACRYVLLTKGSRLRPQLVCSVANHFGKDGSEAALGVEFFHMASLVADDLPCMDDATMRRGQTPVHHRFSESIALLTSYAFISLGYEQIRKGIEDPSRLSLAIAHASYATGLFGAVLGQALDLYPVALDEKSALEIIRKKSGALFALSLVLGWLSGGGPLSSLEEVKEAGMHYGTAYQIADDMADWEEDEKKKSLNLCLLLGRDSAEKLFHQEEAKAKAAFAKLGLADLF